MCRPASGHAPNYVAWPTSPCLLCECGTIRPARVSPHNFPPPPPPVTLPAMIPVNYASPLIPVTTTFTIEGYRIRQYLGIVRGIIVRAPTISQGIIGGLKSIIGGRIGAYTEMCEQTRQQAYDLMIDHARQMGANAVVGLRFDASE